MKNLKTMLFGSALLLMAFAFTASAQDTMMKKGSSKAKPTVALIRADWCSACKQVEPIIQDLMQQSYSGKFKLVVLDVTNEETTAQAQAMAKSLGLSSFFEANKKSTSTVGVFKNKREVFKTTHNPDRNIYVNAFDKALK